MCQQETFGEATKSGTPKSSPGEQPSDMRHWHKGLQAASVRNMTSLRCVPALLRPRLADLRRFVLRSFVAKQTITTIFLVERISDGWSVCVGDERLGLFSTHRQALANVKNRRAMLTAKGQRSTVVVTRHGSSPTKR
jgi:hypothetical protein